MPREVLERKVETYLKQSAALEAFWHTPVTAEMLEREMERQAKGTRMPERLRELYAALGNDPVLVAECLARPILVDRLARGFFAFDGRVHAAARTDAESLRATIESKGLAAFASDPRRSEIEIVRVEDGSENAPETETRRSPREVRLAGEACARRAALPAAGADGLRARGAGCVRDRDGRRGRCGTRARRELHDREGELGRMVERGLANLRGSVAAVGAGLQALPPFAADSGCNRWDNASLDDVPEPRSGPSSVWTGTVLIVWGGLERNTGARYDPAIDTWTPTSTFGAPTPRVGASAVWTGTEMIVWGGKEFDDYPYLDSGGRYDPASDLWLPISRVAGARARIGHTAVWTGTEMIVWGGFDREHRSRPAAATTRQPTPGLPPRFPSSRRGTPTARSGRAIA